MKKIKYLATGLGLAAMVLAGTPVLAASTGDLLQQGLYAEEVEGNLEAAINDYGQVINDRSAPENQIAQALYRQGMCYLKRKDEGSARADLERQINNYTNQTELIAKAKPVLEDLTNFDPATLMPANTLAYVELGNPGRQIETVLAQLKGTPFENPLAAMGGQANGGKTPGDIMGALLNPSMTAEFKKIRGLAVGLTGIANNDPPFIAVFYPGQSDALRGLALAGLGMAGKAGPDLAGMQTMTIQGQLFAAYDDKVILLAQPASQLEWCVKQYKGMISDPTLASANAAFATVPKAQRQKNALTLWGNVAGLYTNLQTLLQDQLPRELMMADAFADFPNMDQLIVTHTLETNQITFQADLRFKTNNHCLVYDLVRTPHISRAGLSGVPAEAVALASFSLSQADAQRTEQMRTGLLHLTGLDIGRELFANIEQITFFLLPLDAKTFGDNRSEAIMNRLGLVITSHHPEQTRQLLRTLLAVNAQAQGNPPPDDNHYPIRIGNNQHTCFLAQAQGNTVLSLNETVLQASVNAVNLHQSVNDSGSLHDAVAALNPNTSKLILLNNASLSDLLLPSGNLQLDDAQQKELDQCFAQYNQAAAATTLEISTTEQLDQLGLKAALDHLPPLNTVFDPLAKMNQIAAAARAASEIKQLRSQQPASFTQTTTAPALDGRAEDLWKEAQVYPIARVLADTKDKPNSLAAQFRGLWDTNNLYLLVEVTDGILRHAADVPWQDNDSVELYLDATNGKSENYGDTDYMFTFNWDATHPEMAERKHDRTNGVEYAVVTTDKGYNVEVKLPWSTLRANPAVGASLGLEVQVNDNRGSAQRDGKLVWQDQDNRAWQSPRAFGNLKLAGKPGLIGWWKFDETDGPTAQDSSGKHHSGTLEGHAKWSHGKIGGAIDLDGQQSYVRIADQADFNLTDRFTVAAWVNMRSIPCDWMTIISKGDTAWRLSTRNQEARFHFGISHGHMFLGAAETATTVNLNEWHQVTAVFEDAVESLYLDGKLEATNRIGDHVGINDFDVLIGNNAEESNRCFDGLIDDVRVYNYALAADQVKALASGRTDN